PAPFPPFFLNGQPLPMCLDAAYLGAMLTSDSPDLLQPHAESQALKSRAVAGRIFSLRNDIGSVPVVDGIQFYKSLVDPYLSYACEISPDVSDALLGPLATAQHNYLRRLLGVNSFAPVCLLFSETGLWPLLFRRLELCLRYLQFLLSLGPERPAFQALSSSLTLWRTRPQRRGWFRDLMSMCTRAGLSVQLDVSLLSIEHIDAVRSSIRPAMRNFQGAAAAELTKISLMKNFLDVESCRAIRNCQAHDFSPRLRSYLSLPDFNHRVALTRLLFSSHSLAVEELRYPIRGHPRLPRDLRLCRFCRSTVETECHALLGCMADDQLCLLRRDFLHAAIAVDAAILHPFARANLEYLLRSLLNNEFLLPATASYVYSVFRRFKQVPIFLAPVPLPS
ncbi:hypothetical protein SISNIDRAFT_418842, partial [Sistotremastrum niveocremeum HHB9708]